MGKKREGERGMGLFDPVWMTDKQEKKWRAVDAVRRIRDEELLLRIAMEAPIYEVHEAAAERIRDARLLEELAFCYRTLPPERQTSSSRCSAATAAGKLTDREKLLDYALTAPFFSHGVFDKLKDDQAALSEIVKNAAEFTFRRKAAELSEDQETLLAVVDELDRKRRRGRLSDREGELFGVCLNRWNALRIAEHRAWREAAAPEYERLSSRMDENTRLGMVCRNCGRLAAYFVTSEEPGLQPCGRGHLACDCGRLDMSLALLDSDPEGAELLELCPVCLESRHGEGPGSLFQCRRAGACGVEHPPLFVRLVYGNRGENT